MSNNNTEVYTLSEYKVQPEADKEVFSVDRNMIEMLKIYQEMESKLRAEEAARIASLYTKKVQPYINLQ